MLKEALKYLVGLGRPELVHTEDGWWTDRELERVSFNPKAQGIKLSTLTSLVDYRKDGGACGEPAGGAALFRAG